MEKTDRKLLELMNELYDFTESEEQDFLYMIEWFTEDEKKEIWFMLFERLKSEEWLFSKFIRKVKHIWNNIEEYKTKLEADKMLLNL